MATTIQKNRKIIDIFTMEVHDISSNLKLKCNEIGIHYTNVTKLEKGTIKAVKSRFTTINNLNKVFTLVDVDSKIEYNCIDNYGIFIHLDYPYSDNEGKYVYELKSGRQKYASICGKVFQLKGSVHNRIKKMKNESNYITTIQDDLYKRRIIKYRISKRIWDAIRNSGRKKDELTETLLGCSMQKFMKYISERFTEGMSWNNYGKFGWHLDHIKPCNSFNLKDKAQQMECFHYSNMQPLWGTTKIAENYGIKNYIGNINKADTKQYEDYYLTSALNKELKDIDKAKIMSHLLVKNGVKKLIIR